MTPLPERDQPPAGRLLIGFKCAGPSNRIKAEVWQQMPNKTVDMKQFFSGTNKASRKSRLPTGWSTQVPVRRPALHSAQGSREGGPYPAARECRSLVRFGG